MSYGLYPNSPASPGSPQSVASSTFLETELGLASQEIVGGEYGQLASELALSHVFLSGLQGVPQTGPASYMAAMTAAMGDEFADLSLLLANDVSLVQPQ